MVWVGGASGCSKPQPTLRPPSKIIDFSLFAFQKCSVWFRNPKNVGIHRKKKKGRGGRRRGWDWLVHEGPCHRVPLRVCFVEEGVEVRQQRVADIQVMDGGRHQNGVGAEVGRILGLEREKWGFLGFFGTSRGQRARFGAWRKIWGEMGSYGVEIMGNEFGVGCISAVGKWKMWN